MGVHPWVDRGHFPYFFEAEGTPCVLSLLFFRGRHFCTNAHGIHWMTGAIFVKFSQLILMKIIKIVANRCQIIRLKCTKFNFGWDSAPDPAKGAYSTLPGALAGFKGPTFKGGEGKEGLEEGVPSTFFCRSTYAHGDVYPNISMHIQL